MRADAGVLPLSGSVAFTPVGAVSGRIVMLIDGLPLAFNPQHVDAGWCLCTREAVSPPVAVEHARDMRDRLGLGTNAQACVEWGPHLVIASGRGGSAACCVSAFSFDHAADVETLRPAQHREGEAAVQSHT